ncbi:hypothetical protein FD755_002907, partial [Muntiacus reevesi]
IERCIKEIQSEVNKQCPDVQLRTTTDCFEWLNNYNYNSSKSPSIPHGDLIKFLKILQDLLKNEQNQEEMVLNLLWDLSCQSSVSFPSTVSGASFPFLSRASLHSVEDHSSMDVKSVWDEIRLHLRRFLVNKLQSHNEINNSQQKILLKNQCIQQLLFLYPESEVTSKYQSIQNKLLTKLLQNCFPSVSRESNLDIMADTYQGTMLKLYSMIKEDFNTLHDILAPSSTVKFIKETYLDTVTEEMAKFLENFCELQFKESAARVVKTSKSSSRHRGTFCSDIMEKLDIMLPLALACRDDSFQEIRANFVEACCKVATAVLARLQERSKEFPSKAPLKNLHTLLSTAVYVFQHFMQYDHVMKENTKKPIFLVPIQRYQEFINSLQFQVTDYCVRVCATSILQDAESHHWDDYKAFYEGERCSFSLQMWHYFFWALHHDLWTILPPKLAQEILAEVLEKSLGLLASRYARAHPKCTFQEHGSNTENNLNQGSSLIEAIFQVLYHCTFSPQTFGNVFVSYMEEEQLWDLLYNTPVSTRREPEVEVIRCLRLALTQALQDVVQQAVSVMSSGSNCETNLNRHSVPECLRDSIPKEWNYIPKDAKRKESSKGFTRLAAQAVSIVISKLPTVIACLPPPIKYFFFLSERKMSENLVELKKAGLLVWNLIVIICRIFEDGNTVELLTGASLDRWSKEKLGLVCVCLESIMGEQTGSPNQMTQKVIRSIEQQKPNWIECQLLKARKLSTECAFMTIEKSTALEEGDIALELTEQKINMMVLDICHKPGGSEYLRQIHHIMRLNEGYLKEQLFSMNGSEEKPLPIQPLKTTLRSVEDQPSAFNPFHVYKVFSKNMLDQSAITKWNWNWSNLLPNYLGLDKMTFSILLKNR